MSESTSTAIEEQAPRFQRKRGTGFPIVPLSECVDVMRTAGKHGTEHSISAFATYLGHSTPNSGSFKRRIASFRDWKFIANATGDRVVFTDLGKRIAYPTDPAKETSDLRQAFENCAIFMKAWDDQAKGVPIGLSALANHGVQLGVSPVSKQQFAESLVESAVAAGFAELDGDKVIFVRPGNRHEGTSERETEILMQQVDERAVQRVEERTADDSRRRRFIEEMEAATAREAERERTQEEKVGPVGRATREALSEDVVRVPIGEPYWRDANEPSPRETPYPREEPYRPERPRVRASRPPADEQPRVLLQQQWDFGVGNLVFEIKSSRSLPSEAFLQIGKVMVEVEKLKELLTEGSESAESTE